MADLSPPESTAAAAAGYDPFHQESVGWRPDDALFREHLSRYQLAASLASGRKVLDCACGKGYGTYTLALSAHAAVGIDLNAASIAVARQSFALPNLRYERCDALALAKAGQSFNLITAFEIIEHLPPAATDDFLDGLGRALAPGGRLLLSTPNHDVVCKSGSAVPDYHINNFRPSELRQALRRHFREVRLYGQFQRRSGLQKAFFAIDVLNSRHTLGRPLKRLLQADGAPDTAARRQETVVGPEYFIAPPSLLDDYVFSPWHWRQAGLTFAICERPVAQEQPRRKAATIGSA